MREKDRQFKRNMQLALLQEKLSPVRYDRGEFNEPHNRRYDPSVFSNESRLFETFPYIRHATGAAIAVGVDQLNEIAINSSIRVGFSLNNSPHAYIAQKAPLDVGLRHEELIGAYPSREELLRYFKKDFIGTTIQFIGNQFQPELQKILRYALFWRIYTPQEIRREKRPLLLHSYLQYKMQQVDYNSWLSSDKNLHYILDMYKEGKLRPVFADITEQVAFKKIAAFLKAEGIPLSVLYLSNLMPANQEEALKDNFNLEALAQNIGLMPVKQDTRVVQSITPGVHVNISIPEGVKVVPYLEDQMMEWEYVIQSIEDFMKEATGQYKYIKDGIVTRAVSFHEREEATWRYGSEGTPQLMGFQKIRPGLYLAGVNPV